MHPDRGLVGLDQRLGTDILRHRLDDRLHLIAAPARPVAESLPGDGYVQPIKALLLTVQGLVLHVLLDHHIGDHAHIRFEAVVLPRRAGHPLMTPLTRHLGIHVDVHFILHRQLDQFLTGILPHLD